MGVEASLVGEKVILVPYVESHLSKYHEWMQDPELLRATGSEPLSLDQDFSVQRSWTLEPLKQSFIVLVKELVEGEFVQGYPHVEAMVGDVNVYMIPKWLSRGKVLGKESVLMMMTFAVENLGIQSFRAKIGDSNVASLSTLRNMDFEDSSYREIFREVTLELAVTESKLKELWQISSHRR